MKKLAIVLVLCSMSYALQAPYLISATATSDSSVGLSWRNNDIATTGYIVQRKDSTATVYKFIDSVKSATQLAYTDTQHIVPEVAYRYQVLAYNSTSVSDTSNSLMVTIPLICALKKPGFTASWDSYKQTRNVVYLNISDSSNCEKGYRIFRADGFSSTFQPIFQVESAIPKNMGLFQVIDSSISLNAWYNYKVEGYSNTDSIFSDPCSTFTLWDTPAQKIVTFAKQSDYPVSTSGGLSAKAGDSIILRESNAPAGKYTIINVKDPTNPQFNGYTDSAALSSYPTKTLIPVFLNFNVFNSYASTKVCQFNDKILVLRDSTLTMYSVLNNSLIAVDSIKKFKGTSIIWLGDTTLMAYQYTTMPDYKYYLVPVQMSPAGFLPFPECIIGYPEAFCTQMPHLPPQCFTYYCEFYFRGISNNRILISEDLSGNYSRYQLIYDISLRRLARVTSNMNANAYSTGYYISSTENLCTNAWNTFSTEPSSSLSLELFVSDIRNSMGRQIDSMNNAIYLDTHKQNALRNILLDTAGHEVFLIFNNTLTILSYQHSTVGVASGKNELSAEKRISIISNASHPGVTIVLPSNCRNADLFIYDINGRVVDKMRNISSNAVFWKPKTKSMACYIVMVKSAGQTHSMKFMTR